MDKSFNATLFNIDRYDEYKLKKYLDAKKLWVEKYGDCCGFDPWFFAQLEKEDTNNG